MATPSLLLTLNLILNPSLQLSDRAQQRHLYGSRIKLGCGLRLGLGLAIDTAYMLRLALDPRAPKPLMRTCDSGSRFLSTLSNRLCT